MPAVSLLAPEQWAEVEKAYILAVPPAEIAAKFDVEVNAIHQRAHRFKWPSPARIAKERALLKKQSINGLSTDNGSNVSNHKSGPSAGQMVAESLQKNGERASLRASQIATNSLDDAPHSLRIQNMSDVKTALSVARIAAGMDRPQQSLTVNFSGLSSHNAQIQVREAQIVEDEEDREE